MEAITMKELSTNATAGDSLLSSTSDAATPIPKHQAQSGSCRDLTMKTPPAWRPSTNAGNGCPENNRETPNSLSSGAENSPQKNPITARRKSRRSSGYDRSDLQQHKEHDALVKLRSELAATRSELDRKDILATSLKHQLDQRKHVEEQTQARSEKDLTVALAEASALKKELERTSQLLMDGAVARQQLEQRCSVLKHELEQSDARANELDQELFEARVQITKVSNELYSRRSTTVEDAEIIFAEEVQRVEAKARRDNDDLREEAGTLRTALERKTSLYEEACSERDTARHEAEEAAENINNLRKEVWSWRDRAEELEHLEQTKRTGSPSRDEAMCLNEAEETIEALKQNLAELQESMEKAREDAITSRGVAAEESAKRAEAETRLETMEAEVEAKAKAVAEFLGRRMKEMRAAIHSTSEMLKTESRQARLENARLKRLLQEKDDRAKALERENFDLVRGINEIHDSTMEAVHQDDAGSFVRAAPCTGNGVACFAGALMYTGTVRKRIGRRQAFPQGYGTVYDGKWKSNAMGERGVLTPTASLQGDITGGTIVYDEFRDNARCERGVKTWPGA